MDFGLSLEELSGRVAEFNPIDNLAPLAKGGVKILHIHGEDDTLVPMSANSTELARRYRLPIPSSIRFVANQRSRWGSCTPSTGEIRVSDRIARFPGWVLDAVIVHELAHLVEAHHGPAFHALADRYPKQERAHGFLLAMQLTGDEIGDA